jgi:hypothetical protein
MSALSGDGSNQGSPCLLGAINLSHDADNRLTKAPSQVSNQNGRTRPRAAASCDPTKQPQHGICVGSSANDGLNVGQERDVLFDLSPSELYHIGVIDVLRV